MTEWISVGHGLQYRKHPSRKHGVRFDRYFRGRYTVEGKTVAIGFGWESEDWSQSKCLAELSKFKEAAKTGEGPATMKEKLELGREKKEAERITKEQKEKESVTFGQYFKKTYLPTARLTKKPMTISAEEGYFKNWLEPVVGNMTFKDIYPLHFERVKRDMLKKERAPRSVQYCLAIARQAWNQARRDGVVDRACPTKEVKLPKIDNKRMRFLTHDEADRLLENLSGRSKQLHDMALLSLNTGMRAGEVFSLKWGALDLEQGLIYVVDAKAGSRTAYMTDEVKTMLKSLKEGQPDELVFKDRKGKRIKKISLSFVRAVDDLGLNNGVIDHRQKVLFHTCRHTFASWLVQQGTPLYTVQKLMGHATIVMTMRYSHLAPDTLRSAMDSFEEHLKAEKSGDRKVLKLKNE